MELIDSHTHLDLLARHGDHQRLCALLERAASQDVTGHLCVSINRSGLPAMLSLVEPYPQIWASVGIHPNESTKEDASVEELVTWAQHPKVIAIGETGLDLYRDVSHRDLQIIRLKQHIAAAREAKKPLIIHMREATQETLTILEKEKAHEVGGILHCFTENWTTAQRALSLGFMISFSGILTFPNADKLRGVARKTPLESMLIETDSPYLAPVPHRGKTNEPAFVRYVAQQMAELKEVSLETIGRATTENFRRLFAIPESSQPDTA